MDSGRLQIILVTYNRCKFARRTLETILSGESPVRDCEVLVLDNNSTDGTAEMVKEMMEHHPNLGIRTNRYNVGGAGNIFKAMELVSREYVWILGDDDLYDFSNWGEVETAMAQKEKIICLSRDFISAFGKDTLAIRALQVSLITACIIRTELYTDETIFDSCVNTYTLSPHMVPVFHHLNVGGGIYAVARSVVSNGALSDNKDLSFDRGVVQSQMSPIVSAMKHAVGYAAVCNVIKDRKLRNECFMAIVYDVHGSKMRFLKMLNRYYRQPRLLPQLAMVAAAAPADIALAARFMAFLGRPSLISRALCRLRMHVGGRRNRERFSAVFNWNSRFS